MRPLILLVTVFLATLESRADRVAEIARIHLEAIGGQARVAALSAMRMTGTVMVGSQPFSVTILAARPARLRAETQVGERVIVQASDGAAPPWQMDSAAATAGATILSPAAAERFLADAEFDDPLVRARSGGGLTLEFAGETVVDGRKLLRVLLARKLTENVFVFLDAQTYLIVMRRQELQRGERRVELVTRYTDYRPVSGVLMPHEVSLFEDGQLTQRATFHVIEGNPPTSDEMFRRP